ncbi:MAG TPA: hypothetical protein VHV28_07535 [Solirubrobacteraceae bacterium]|nr:hypothetical protein [Solirubrobacteraceae bacterium]
MRPRELDALVVAVAVRAWVTVALAADVVPVAVSAVAMSADVVPADVAAGVVAVPPAAGAEVALDAAVVPPTLHAASARVISSPAAAPPHPGTAYCLGLEPAAVIERLTSSTG